MLTRADLLRCAIAPFENDLDGLSIEEAKRELDEVQDRIDEDTAWAEALAGYIELEAGNVPA